METIPMTVIPSGVPRASMIRRAVAVKVVRSAPPPDRSRWAAGVALMSHAAKPASRIKIGLLSVTSPTCILNGLLFSRHRLN